MVFVDIVSSCETIFLWLIEASFGRLRSSLEVPIRAFEAFVFLLEGGMALAELIDFVLELTDLAR